MSLLEMPTTLPPTPAVVPPLESGDVLSREEFLRRGEAMGGVRAERIGGVVVMPASISAKDHGHPLSQIQTLLGIYHAHTPGTKTSSPATTHMGPDDDPEPDVMRYVKEDHGGRVRVTGEGYLEGPPELIVEVANTSAAADLVTKRDLYEREGVSEYIVWLYSRRRAVGHRHGDGGYDRVETVPVYQSVVFPGLWIDFEALHREDLLAAMNTLQEGLATEDHAAFVKGLAEAK